MNTAVRDLIAARAAGAVAVGKALGSVDHAGLKGSLREILVRDLLRPLFPPGIGIGHGVIVTAYDQQSSEQDVVIFDRTLVPPVVLEGEIGLFPVEAALFTVEVKSELTSTELRSAHEKARRLERLQHVPGSRTPEHVLPYLFAFSSDLTQKDELVRYQELLETSEPAIVGLCVAGRGYWYRQNGCWRCSPPTASFDEVLHWVAGLADTYARVSRTRSDSDSLFISYLREL